MIFANTDKEITVIYYSEEHIGRQILAYAQTENLPIHDVDLAHVKLTPTHWVELAARLKIPVKDLINTDDPDFLQKFNGHDNFSDDDWLKLLIHNPDILKAPIVMKGEKIVQMSNSQDMLYFLEE
jgi:arsenate reductase